MMLPDLIRSIPVRSRESFGFKHRGMQEEAYYKIVARTHFRFVLPGACDLPANLDLNDVLATDWYTIELPAEKEIR